METISANGGKDSVLQGASSSRAINCEKAELDGLGDVPAGGRNEFVEPAIGMEFESYEDAYDYYNCYAKEIGFRARVKNSWYKRSGKEKYAAVLCCNSQGFKKVKEVNRLREETRTGCPAMIRLRLTDVKRWRIREASLEHNHLLGSKINRCKNMASSSGLKKYPLSSSLAEVQKVKLCKALVINDDANGSPQIVVQETSNSSNLPDRLKLNKGDAQAIYRFLCRMQLTYPNFFHLADLSDEGGMKNFFWVDARSRAANDYFGDVVFIDNLFLSSNYEVPLVAFVGINHHAQHVLLGCGMLSGETADSYKWIFKTWLSCRLGKHPHTIISDRSRILQNAISEVFPKCQHRFDLSLIMKKVPEKLGGLRHYDAIRKALFITVYESLKPYDFEAAWRFMFQRFEIADNEWLQSLYEDRSQWVPAFLKDSSFVGLATVRLGETMTPFFDKSVQKQTTVKEFLDKHELALYRKHKEESLADIDSINTNPELKTKCSYEMQVSKLYTLEMFRRFQKEAEAMYSCFSSKKLHSNGSISVFLVKERIFREENKGDVFDYEVLYNSETMEVRCICSLFSFYGYLCRHALAVLNVNGAEQIPASYVLPRWKKGYKRLHSPDQVSGNVIDASEKAQRFGQLQRSAMQMVEEGVVSLDHYKAALESFEDCLQRIHNVERKDE